MDYKIIRMSFVHHHVDHMKYAIKQAICLQLNLDRIRRKETIKMDKELVVKLDIETMVYPSITYQLVEDAVHYYVREFSGEETAKFEVSLDMLKLSMSNCLINFREKYSWIAYQRDAHEKLSCQ